MLPSRFFFFKLACLATLTATASADAPAKDEYVYICDGKSVPVSSAPDKAGYNLIYRNMDLRDKAIKSIKEDYKPPRIIVYNSIDGFYVELKRSALIDILSEDTSKGLLLIECDKANVHDQDTSGSLIPFHSSLQILAAYITLILLL